MKESKNKTPSKSAGDKVAEGVRPGSGGNHGVSSASMKAVGRNVARANNQKGGK